MARVTGGELSAVQVARLRRELVDRAGRFEDPASYAAGVAAAFDVLTGGPSAAGDRAPGGGARTRSQRRRAAFLADVAHVLRTPLTPIRGYAELLAGGGLTEGQVEQFAGRIADAAAQMEWVVDRLVDFAVLDSDRGPGLEPTDVGRVVEAALQRCRGRDSDRRLVARVPVGLPAVQADPDLLERVVVELVDNAVRFTDDPVVVTADHDGQRVRITVWDQGPGLGDGPEAAAGGPAAPPPPAEGGGLGLVLVGWIVDRFGGRLVIDPEPASGPGSGVGVDLRVAGPPDGDGGRPARVGYTLSVGSAVMQASRHVRLLSRALEAATEGSLLERMCRAAVDMVGVDGVGMVATSQQGGVELVAASDQGVVDGFELQFRFGEGPCFDATANNLDVLVGDVAEIGPGRWPAYTSAALDAGVGAVFALAARVGAIRLGALYLQRGRPGSLSEDELADGRVLAEVATMLLLDEQTGVHPDGDSPQVVANWPDRAVVHQATGMVSVQLGGDLADALARLRARAFSDGVPLARLAAEVVAGRLRFDT